MRTNSQNNRLFPNVWIQIWVMKWPICQMQNYNHRNAYNFRMYTKLQDTSLLMSLTGLVNNFLKYVQNEIKSLTLLLLPQKQAKCFLFLSFISFLERTVGDGGASFFVAMPSYIILFNHECGMDSQWKYSGPGKDHSFLLRLLLTRNNTALSLSYYFVLLSNRLPYINDQRKDVSRPAEAKDIPKSLHFHLIPSQRQHKVFYASRFQTVALVQGLKWAGSWD